jgi:hypothetical protein
VESPLREKEVHVTTNDYATFVVDKIWMHIIIDVGSNQASRTSWVRKLKDMYLWHGFTFVKYVHFFKPSQFL